MGPIWMHIFFPLNHKVMGDIKVSNVFISVQYIKLPWKDFCLSHKYSYTYDYLTMQFQRNGAFVP